MGFHEFRKSTLNTDFKAYRGCEDVRTQLWRKEPVASGKHLVFDKADRRFPARERPGCFSILNSDHFLLREKMSSLGVDSSHD